MPAAMDALALARTCTAAVDTARSAPPSARCLGLPAADASITRHQHGPQGGREMSSIGRSPCPGSSAAPSLCLARPQRPGNPCDGSHAAFSRHGSGIPAPASLTRGHVVLLWTAFLPGTERLTSDCAARTRLGNPGLPGLGGHGHRTTRGSPGVVKAMVDIPEAGHLRDALFATAGALTAFTLSAGMAWVVQRNNRKVKDAAQERGPASIPELSSGGLAQALEMGLGIGGQKESVEWVNMVLHKIWKVYRRSLEAWLVGLLQPAIDTLPLPSVVRRVEIAEFSLDFEPLSVRNVQRRASRRANDLQYHVGLRYTGDARCLLLLHLTVAGLDFAVPVGVHNLDVDAELWVKLRLTPRKPYVGTLSIAFVRLPTIKLVLAPFRIVNLFAIPFLSDFLSRLLTIDLPRLLVLPRHITFDFLPAGEDVSQPLHTGPAPGVQGAPPHGAPGTAGAGASHGGASSAYPYPTPSAAAASANMVLDLLRSETFTGLAGEEPLLVSPVRTEPSDAFVGELSVTLCEARNLPTFGLAVWSNPYCRLMVGESIVESKKNSETSHPAGARDPVWNQDFLFWVEDPAQQKLTVVLRDSMAPLSRNIGFVEVPIWQLQDCAPLSMWLPLLQDGPFGVKPAQGEVRLLLTYKSYVDQERSEYGGSGVAGAPGAALSSAPGAPTDVVAYIKVFGSDEGEGGSSEGLGSLEGGDSSEGDSDGERERERELQRERAAKGLDRLGEEPGVEIVASNAGHFSGGALVGDPLSQLSDPTLDPSLTDPLLVDPTLDPLGALPGGLRGSERDAEGAPLPTASGAPLAPAGGEAKSKSILGGVWSATKAMTLGAVGIAGGVVGATGGLMTGLGGVVASGVGSVGRAVGGFVSRQQDELPEEPLYYYEDDDYFTQDPMSVRVRSYPEDGADLEEGQGEGGEGARARRGRRRGDAPRGYYADSSGSGDDSLEEEDDEDDFEDFDDEEESGGHSGVTRSLTLGERPDDYFDAPAAGGGARGPYSEDEGVWDEGGSTHPGMLPGVPGRYPPGPGESSSSGVPAAFDDFVRGAQEGLGEEEREGEWEGGHGKEQQGAGTGAGTGAGLGLGMGLGMGAGLLTATLEQRVARLVEFNLDQRQDLLRGIATSPRLETSLGGEESSEERESRGEGGAGGGEPSASSGGVGASGGGRQGRDVGEGERERRERGRDGSPRRGKPRGAGNASTSGRAGVRPRDTALGSGAGTGTGTSGAGGQGAGAGPRAGARGKQEGTRMNASEGGSQEGQEESGESKDRWRSVQGAISDLMDFFSR